jgi:hypothetical protein
VLFLYQGMPLKTRALKILGKPAECSRAVPNCSSYHRCPALLLTSMGMDAPSSMHTRRDCRSVHDTRRWYVAGSCPCVNGKGKGRIYPSIMIQAKTDSIVKWSRCSQRENGRISGRQRSHLTVVAPSFMGRLMYGFRFSYAWNSFSWKLECERTEKMLNVSFSDRFV